MGSSNHHRSRHHHAVSNPRYPERSEFLAVRLRNPHPSDCIGSVRLPFAVSPPVRQASGLPHTPRCPQSPARPRPVRLCWPCTDRRGDISLDVPNGYATGCRGEIVSPARPLETILSLSGVPLEGGHVRMVYLDEAGISNPKHEPFIVVAGVIIHADYQWKAIEAHIRSLVADFIPQSDQDGFVFHAAGSYFSGGKYFDRDVWPRCIRWQILDELVAIPRKFDLPISCGVQNRSSSCGSIHRN